jgi:hypothetical protein
MLGLGSHIFQPANPGRFRQMARPLWHSAAPWFRIAVFGLFLTRIAAGAGLQFSDSDWAETPSQAQPGVRSHSWLDSLQDKNSTTPDFQNAESDPLKEFTFGPDESESRFHELKPDSDSVMETFASQSWMGESTENESTPSSCVTDTPQLTPGKVFQDHTDDCVSWRMLPQGLLFHSYLAAEREPRMKFVHRRDTKSNRTVWDAVLGGRVGLIRLGTSDPHPTEGFQIDLEGAVFARVLPNERSAQLEGSDYRVGIYATGRDGNRSWKTGYYHISAHVGDEFLVVNPTFQRINYVRDSWLGALSLDLSESTRVYGELGYAIGTQGGAEPLELQLGAEYTPTPSTGLRGAPFGAMNVHFRQEFDLQPGVSASTGWGWQGAATRHRLRLALSIYNGPSWQYEFFDRWENLVGGGIWLDY